MCRQEKADLHSHSQTLCTKSMEYHGVLLERSDIPQTCQIFLWMNKERPRPQLSKICSMNRWLIRSVKLLVSQHPKRCACINDADPHAQISVLHQDIYLFSFMRRLCCFQLHMFKWYTDLRMRHLTLCKLAWWRRLFAQNRWSALDFPIFGQLTTGNRYCWIGKI